MDKINFERSKLHTTVESCFKKAISNENMDEVYANMAKCMDSHWEERSTVLKEEIQKLQSIVEKGRPEFENPHPKYKGENAWGPPSADPKT